MINRILETTKLCPVCEMNNLLVKTDTKDRTLLECKECKFKMNFYLIEDIEDRAVHYARRLFKDRNMHEEELKNKNNLISKLCDNIKKKIVVKEL